MFYSFSSHPQAARSLNSSDSFNGVVDSLYHQVCLPVFATLYVSIFIREDVVLQLLL